MKKALVLLSVFIAALALPLFADDALVLPKGVLRTYLTFAYGFGDSHWDPDGEKQDGYNSQLAADNALSAINLSFAAEYGVTEWITGGIQWAPGINVGSKLEDTGLEGYSIDGEALVNGTYDLKVGAKLQIVGPEGAPVQNDKIRFSVTPGVKIPLGGADYKEEAENAVADDDFIIADPAKHAFAIGSQAFFDYVLNEMVFFNLYCEYMKYFEKKDAYKGTMAYALGDTAKYDIAYGYDLILEFEPHFGTQVGPGKLGLGLPVTYSMAPATEYDGEDGGADGSYSLSIGPSASYLFTVGPLPFEVKLGYTLPLLGQNDSVTNQVVFQLKSYLKF